MQRAATVLLGDLTPDLRDGPVDPERLRLAFCEDAYEVLAGLELLDAGVACRSNDLADARSLTWPNALLLDSARPAGDASEVLSVLAALADRGYEQVALLSFDAPDFPGLLIGKLFRGLARADVAVCPADGGGLVALATRLPLASWLADAGVELNTRDAVEALRRAAPSRRLVHVAPGWHRVRSLSDLSRLDHGLEGWEATRRLLGRGPA